MPNSSPPVGFRIKPRTPTAKKAIPNTEATALTILPPSRLAAAMTASLQPLVRFYSPPPSLPTASRYQPIYNMSSIYLFYLINLPTGLQKKLHLLALSTVEVLQSHPLGPNSEPRTGTALSWGGQCSSFILLWRLTDLRCSGWSGRR